MTTIYFSDEEIQELEEFKDGTLGTSVDGEELICFRIMDDLIQGRIENRAIKVLCSTEK
ncbi:hypothetical protein [Paenibacillus elgii]|uniref:hypothetical protein n=1 Tax=Paenibacillus elgii TaxID=189691 RepID=UPI0013D8DCBC|nr:hypothetical protein [Paenibacillus elgii]